MVLGPSGAGKDTLIAGAVAARPGLVWARRVVTRPESAGSEPFEGVAREEFKRRRAAGAFAIWWEAHGLLYAVPATAKADLNRGRDVIFNGSRRAARQARLVFPLLRTVFVTAPPDSLRQRLIARGRESAADIEARLDRAAPPPPKGAALVKNDGPVEAGVARLLAALDQPRRYAEDHITSGRLDRAAIK